MAGVSVAAAKFPVVITAEHEATVTLTVADDDGPYVWAGTTVTADIIGHQTITGWTVTTPTTGTLVLTLADTQTTALGGPSAYSWALSAAVNGDDQPWLAGTLTVLAKGTPGATTSVSGAITVAAGAAATVTITGGVAGPTGPTGIPTPGGNLYLYANFT